MKEKQVMVSATDKPWNSPMTLYIARRLQDIAKGQKIAVLDMGCGKGTTLEFLSDYGYDLYGYDFPECSEALRKKFSSYFGESYEKHIRFMEDERTIPFDDNSFDVVYANQVCEHVKLFSQMMSECCRVLKPNGVLLANFPLATKPIEGHVKIPFAHWMAPGKMQFLYLYVFSALGLGSNTKRGSSVSEKANFQESRLQKRIYYRFMNEVQNVAEFYFKEFEINTDLFIRAKLDMMAVDRKMIERWSGSFVRLFEGNILDYVVTNYLNAAFCMRYPKKD